MSKQSSASDPSALDFHVRNQARNFLNTESLRQIMSASDSTPYQIIRDIISLGFGKGKVSFNDYIEMRLFDESWLCGARKEAFVGKAAFLQFIEQINFRSDDYGLLRSKIASYGLFRTFGLPVIELKAIYAPGMKCPSGRIITNKASLVSFLSDSKNYPLFGKPDRSLQSLGVMALVEYDASRGEALTMTAKRISVSEIAEDIHRFFGSQKYVFQPILSPHKDVIAALGSRLATIRIMTMRTEEGPKVFRAAWKMPSGRNIADNFWRDGNMVAGLDVVTGRVQKVASGKGFDLQDVQYHPETGVDLTRLEAPDWKAACATAIEGAKILDSFGIIGWDIAITDDGPVVVEANESPDFGLMQIATRRGILCPEFDSLLALQKTEKKQFHEERRRLSQDYIPRLLR